MDERTRDLTSGMTIDELAREVDLPVRTVRYYIAQGLLPGPGARGKAASYGAEHLLRLRLIRLLAERHLPLSDIRARLQALGFDELRALLHQEQGQSDRLERLDQSRSPRDYVAALLQGAREARAEPGAVENPAAEPMPFASRADALRAAPRQRERSSYQPEAWERWELAPGVELQVRADVRARHRGLIERVLRAARDSLGPSS